VEVHVLRRRRRTYKHMSISAVLYIPDKTVPEDPVTGALRNAGYEVVSADSSSEGVALLFLMHSVAAVVMHDQLGERSGVDLARTLRSIRPEVAIILLSLNPIDSLPPYVDVPVSLSQPFDMVTSTVPGLLAAIAALRVCRKASSRCAAA
jgi:CheY-like chemotaxis protein